jgi:hypothetical protein
VKSFLVHECGGVKRIVQRNFPANAEIFERKDPGIFLWSFSKEISEKVGQTCGFATTSRQGRRHLFGNFF